MWLNYPIASIDEIEKAKASIKSYQKERMSTNTSSNVSVGLSTKAGFGTALVAFAGAVIDHFTKGSSATAVELAGLGLISGGITQVGRYLQAHGQIKAAAQVEELDRLYANPVGIETIEKDTKKVYDQAKKDVHAGIADAEGIIHDSAHEVEKVVEQEIYPDISDLAVAPQPAPGVVPPDNSKLAASPATTTGA